jgi:hypothetical protein
VRQRYGKVHRLHKVLYLIYFDKTNFTVELLFKVKHGWQLVIKEEMQSEIAANLKWQREIQEKVGRQVLKY